MKKYPDEGTFPDSRGKMLEKSGLIDTGYHDKRGTPVWKGADGGGLHSEVLNRLPPGDDIEDQHLSMADVTAKRLAKVKEVGEDGDYPGSGWDNDRS